MGLFNKLFGPKQPVRPPRTVEALVAHLARPALRLQPGLPIRSATPAHSWFLGEPDPSPGSQRPTWKGKPLGHLATLDLEQAQTTLALDWLPSRGSLAFFYDLGSQPSGNAKNRGAWSVMYRPERATSRSPDSRPMTFQRIRTYPPAERLEANAFDFNDEEWDLYCDLATAQTDVEYAHQLGGYQSLIQGDSLEDESESGLAGRQFDHEVEASPTDWRLLLQVASDKSLDFMWGDAGNLYFMIREADARAGRFDQAWLIDQCF